MARKRANGEGSLFKRADGRWVGAISAGRDADGRQVIRRVYASTQKDARLKLEKLKASHGRSSLANAAPTLAEYLEHWLTHDVARQCKASTQVVYETEVRLRISPQIGHLKVDALKAPTVKGWVAGLERSGCSPRQQAKAFSTLRRALTVAMKEYELIAFNPCTQVVGPSYAAPEAEPLDVDQAKRLIASLEGNRYRALLILAITSGMRQGELIGLQWPDVDLDAGTVRVVRSHSQVKGFDAETTPKTRKSRRQIVIPKLAVDALRELPRGPSDRVFSGPRHPPLNR